MSVLISLEEEEAALLVDISRQWVAMARTRMNAGRKGKTLTKTKRPWKQEKVIEVADKIARRLRLSGVNIESPHLPVDEDERRVVRVARPLAKPSVPVIPSDVLDRILASHNTAHVIVVPPHEPASVE